MRRPELAAILMVFLLLETGRPATAGEALPRAQPDQVGLDLLGLQRVSTLFRDAVNRKQIAGAVVLVARHGKVAYREAFGKQDAEAGIAMEPRSIFRIASMSKPITSTAVMMLADQGQLELSDPISRYIPEFKFMKVAKLRKPGSAGDEYDLIDAYRPITIRDLLMHTSGLSYRMFDRPVLGRLYAEAGICDGLAPCDHSLAENVRRLARLPLLHQPGTAWEYGLNTDVLGRLIEVVSGQSLDAFLPGRILRPLKMDDTHFVLPESKRNRLAALYEPGPDQKVVRTGEGPTVRGALIYSSSLPYRGSNGYDSGGAGLVSTADDYARFLQMLLNRGQLDGVRLLRPETVDAMTRPQSGSLPLWILVHGSQFGYGFGVTTRLDAEGKKDAVGSFSWGGIYYTDFWVDPKQELIGIMLTQILPSGHLNLRDGFHRLVNEAVRP
ncbi:MAG: serine hydrolase domain-containing protein [Isosphaeraceae bacterium]